MITKELVVCIWNDWVEFQTYFKRKDFGTTEIVEAKTKIFLPLYVEFATYWISNLVEIEHKYNFVSGIFGHIARDSYSFHLFYSSWLSFIYSLQYEFVYRFFQCTYFCSENVIIWSVSFGKYTVGVRFTYSVVFGHSLIFLNRVKDVCVGAIGAAGKVCL